MEDKSKNVDEKEMTSSKAYAGQPCPICLENLAVGSQGENLGLRCSNQHSICLECGRKMAFMSDASPTKMKYDCPICRIGCVLGPNHAMALIKGTYQWYQNPHAYPTGRELGANPNPGIGANLNPGTTPPAPPPQPPPQNQG